MDTNDDKNHVAVQKRKDSQYTNVAELIEHPYRKKWTSTPTSYYTQKPTLDVIDPCMHEVKKNKTFRGKYGRLFWGKQKNA